MSGPTIARADDRDMAAAADLVGVLTAIEGGSLPGSDEDFDDELHEHCQRALRAILAAATSGQLRRILLGMSVCLHPENEILDPDADHIAKHPKILAAERRIDDLVTLVHRLRSSLLRAAPDHALPEAALDFLKQNGLQGAPLQSPESSPSSTRREPS